MERERWRKVQIGDLLILKTRNGTHEKFTHKNKLTNFGEINIRNINRHARLKTFDTFQLILSFVVCYFRHEV